MTNIVVQLNPDMPPTGSDLGIANAARRSFGTRSTLDEDGNLKEGDKGLLRFLSRGMKAEDYYSFLDKTAKETDLRAIEKLLWDFRNTPTHDTPFNHGFISFEVQAPIFVRAQLVKHEYLIMSEFSRRYKTDGLEFYDHTYREAVEDKKQGSGGPIEDQEYQQSRTASLHHQCVTEYERALYYNVCPEQARGLLPQDLMTSWTWSGSLGAFANMCKLRLHPEAQHEARLVAQGVYEELKKQWPVSAKLLVGV